MVSNKWDIWLLCKFAAELLVCKKLLCWFVAEIILIVFNVVFKQELQEVQNLERLRVEQQAVALQRRVQNKSPPSDVGKFEPCMVCGDKASGLLVF